MRVKFASSRKNGDLCYVEFFYSRLKAEMQKEHNIYIYNLRDAGMQREHNSKQTSTMNIVKWHPC